MTYTINSLNRMFLIPVLFLLFVGSSFAQQKKQTKKVLGKDHAEKMAKGLGVFKKEIKPLLMSRCVRCHGGRRTRGEFDLTDRKEFLKGGSSGPAVIIGKGKESLLYKLVTRQREPFMPESGKKLTKQQTDLLAKWIDLGAPFDDPLVARKESGPSWTERKIDPEEKQFWSFRPLRSVSPPKVKNRKWCRNPVDQFILADLDKAGIKPNPEAPKRNLIRRAYFDLTGLPPSPEEVKAFQNDDSADAYEKLIDKLLASPHYGERWARHWLDLARFAESHGFEHDYDRPYAYHYRDFVIKAFNQDLPYNTFVRWQIAGDELEPDSNLANMATGFLAAGVHSTQITKNEVEKHRYDEMDDKLNTIGTAMLGLSIGCARCHDHKYDPIPQADYYRMLSTFTTTIRARMELEFNAESYAQNKAAFNREHQPLVDALESYEKEILPGRLAAWEKNNPTFSWIILDSLNAKSAGGAKFLPQADGSILVTGKNPRNDTYTITAETDRTGITAIRLEALSHPSFVKKGPGRAKNGNFALTDFRVTIKPKSGKAKPMAVKLINPRATYEQRGLPIRAAIDKNKTSGWAVDPQFGMDHAAVFELEKPVGFPDGSILTFTLQFKNNVSHSIGRPRFSLTTRKDKLALQVPGMPQTIRSILALPDSKRSQQQQSQLIKWFGKTVDSEGKNLHQKIEDHLAKAPKKDIRKVLVATEGLKAVRLHTQGQDFFEKTYYLRRGDPNNKEGVADPGFLQVLMKSPMVEKRWKSTPPKGWRTSYRRVGLANWITDVEHGAGNLLARVIVNRLWKHHLGRGIVATPSNFGKRGAPPTHPELLDFLANELIKNDWRLKPIHKLIMTSATYRVSSNFDPVKAKIDPDNKKFWCFNPRRLEGEIIRDSLLAVSGVLDRKMFGPGTLDEASKRRSIYFTVKRSKLIPMMQIFDAPQALTGVGKRPTTTIAPQALLMMNNPQVRNWAKAFARRISPENGKNLESAVRKGYWLALSREPTDAELSDSIAFVREQMKMLGGDSRREQAFSDFCQVLMCLNEFIYVD